jgi:RHS repeat-associated protein
LAERTRYEPFGGIIEGGQSRNLFTGQEYDKESGIYYYGARYYNPTLMRWVQADPMIQNPYDPQALNRYSYVKNNPMRYTDPTGKKLTRAKNNQYEDENGNKIFRTDIIVGGEIVGYVENKMIITSQSSGVNEIYTDYKVRMYEKNEQGEIIGVSKETKKLSDIISENKATGVMGAIESMDKYIKMGEVSMSVIGNIAFVEGELGYEVSTSIEMLTRLGEVKTISNAITSKSPEEGFKEFAKVIPIYGPYKEFQELHDYVEPLEPYQRITSCSVYTNEPDEYYQGYFTE